MFVSLISEKEPGDFVAVISEQLDDQMLFIPNRTCKECGRDHKYRPTFEHVKTSVDVIPELIRYMKLSEKPTIGQHCIE